jgi:hypothetical protein
LGVLALFIIGPIITTFKSLTEVLFDARTDLNQIIRETDHSLQTLDGLQKENEDAREAVVSEAERIGAMEAGLEQGASKGYHYPGDEALVAEHSSTAQIIEEDRASSHEGESVTQNDTDPQLDRNDSELDNTSTKLLLYQEGQVFSSTERDSGLSPDELRSRIDILVTQEEELDEYINKVEHERIVVEIAQEAQKRLDLGMEQKENKLKQEEKRRRSGLFDWCTIL